MAAKGKKKVLLDEDDEELEAELRELEHEKREQEALERAETLKDGDETSDSLSTKESASASQFQELYNTILEKTTPSSKPHELPAHSMILHLAEAISTKEQALFLPKALEQWRQKNLPITVLVSYKLIQSICKAGSPETALEFLGDREKYGLSPGQSTMRRVIRAFVKD
ncbi:hypothetical protein BGZ65_012888, partial [Modicella reniformis]